MVIQKVLSFIHSNSLLPPGEAVIVGVSGGPDSVCLLHLLHRLSARLDIRLHVAHLNHMLRDHEAEVEADYVRQLATRLGLPFTIDARNVRAYQEDHHLSEEEAAREVRYAFLSEVAEQADGARVAVGHTADDQVETVLMHIVRGTGLAGLPGMDPVSVLRVPRLGRRVTIVRPLLEVWRDETEEYCEKEKLSPHYDATNLSPAFLRNRIRSELVPLLQSYNPAAKDAIRRLARLAREDLGYIEDEIARCWPQLARIEKGLVVLRTSRILCLHPSLQRHALRRAVVAVLGDAVDIEATHIEAMAKAMAKPVGTRLSLPRELAFQVGYDVCFIGRGPFDSSPWPRIEGEHPLAIPGETRLPGWIVKAQIMDRDRAAEHNLFSWHAHFDVGLTGDRFVVRGRRPGERFQPLGMGEVKKLQDFMVDAKIPRAWRDSIPLVASPAQIIWVVGWRPDEQVKVTPATQQVLCMTFEPTNQGDNEIG